jgi:hypothetical protein
MFNEIIMFNKEKVVLWVFRLFSLNYYLMELENKQIRYAVKMQTALLYPVSFIAKLYFFFSKKKKKILL